MRYFTRIYIKRLRKTKKKLRILFETETPKKCGSHNLDNLTSKFWQLI